MYGSNRASLRIEKNNIKTQIRALESNLSKNGPLTRAYKKDLDKIAKLKNNLVEIDIKIRKENEQLNKLKSANLQIVGSPLFSTMFKTPPKNVTDRMKETELNTTFEKSPPKNSANSKDTSSVQQQPPPTTSTISGIFSLTAPDPAKASNTSTFGPIGSKLPIPTQLQNNPNLASAFDAQANWDTPFLLSSSGGAISKDPSKNVPPITSQLATNLLLSPYKSIQTQAYQTPIVSQSKKLTQAYSATAQAGDDLYTLKPPIFPSKQSLELPSENAESQLNKPPHDNMTNVATGAENVLNMSQGHGNTTFQNQNLRNINTNTNSGAQQGYENLASNYAQNVQNSANMVGILPQPQMPFLSAGQQLTSSQFAQPGGQMSMIGAYESIPQIQQNNVVDNPQHIQSQRKEQSQADTLLPLVDLTQQDHPPQNVQSQQLQNNFAQQFQTPQFVQNDQFRVNNVQQAQVPQYSQQQQQQHYANTAQQVQAPLNAQYEQFRAIAQQSQAPRYNQNEQSQLNLVQQNLVPQNVQRGQPQLNTMQNLLSNQYVRNQQSQPEISQYVQAQQLARHDPSQMGYTQQNQPLQNLRYEQHNEPVRQINFEHPNVIPQNAIRSARPRDTFLRRLRCIPKFNGDSFQQMKEFIDVVDSLYISATNENEESELSEQTLLQLRGEARNIIMSLNNSNWSSVKNKLLKHFNYLANKEILTSQLENAHQEENETLGAYADRVRKLLTDKNQTYSYMTEEQKLEHNRTARRAFSKGISNMKLRNRLVTRGAASLEDAIAYAIEAESDEMNYVPPSDLFCRSCNQNGHRSRNCTRSRDNNNDMNRLISALRAFSTNRPNINSANRGFNIVGRMNNFRNEGQNLNTRNYNMPNRNWNSTGAFNRSYDGQQNRAWNTSPNFGQTGYTNNFNRTWNPNRVWNQAQNGNDQRSNLPAQAERRYNDQSTSSQNYVPSGQGQSQNYNQRRFNDRQRQNNAINYASSSGTRPLSSSDTVGSEN